VGGTQVVSYMEYSAFQIKTKTTHKNIPALVKKQ